MEIISKKLRDIFWQIPTDAEVEFYVDGVLMSLSCIEFDKLWNDAVEIESRKLAIRLGTENPIEYLTVEQLLNILLDYVKHTDLNKIVSDIEVIKEQDIASKIEYLSASISELKTDNTTNKTNIQSHKSAIDHINSIVSGYDTRITKNEADISDISGKVAQNTSKIEQSSDEISENTSKLLLHTAQIELNKSKVEQLTLEVENLTKQLEQAATKITELTLQITNLPTKLYVDTGDTNALASSKEYTDIKVTSIEPGGNGARFLGTIEWVDIIPPNNTIPAEVGDLFMNRLTNELWTWDGINWMPKTYTTIFQDNDIFDVIHFIEREEASGWMKWLTDFETDDYFWYMITDKVLDIDNYTLMYNDVGKLQVSNNIVDKYSILDNDDYDELQNKIAENTLNISQNASQVAQNKLNISQNTNKIAENSSAIAQNTIELALISPQVSNNTTRLTAAEGDITTNKNNISALDLRVSNHDTTLLSHTTDLFTKGEQITTLTVGLDELKQDVSKIIPFITYEAKDETEAKQVSSANPKWLVFTPEE